MYGGMISVGEKGYKWIKNVSSIFIYKERADMTDGRKEGKVIAHAMRFFYIFKIFYFRKI